MTPADFVKLCRDLQELGVTRVEAAGFVAIFPAKGPRLHVDKAADRLDKRPNLGDLSPAEQMELELKRELQGLVS